MKKEKPVRLAPDYHKFMDFGAYKIEAKSSYPDNQSLLLPPTTLAPTYYII
ncbi:hypothetical protein OKW21_004731 [Catalinimonas alkaloidigena]|uniref:hypothetical protein n=1 Tax=Catalinimonas alkaloidigena TaxID=1075417 RepID=UPI0024060E03|nr:hypothetical protein [Catalinimonas alkaloidigena]MDF9799468.1 hypothetical protein [Catalinimonas alkaloidigena]